MRIKKMSQRPVLEVYVQDTSSSVSLTPGSSSSSRTIPVSYQWETNEQREQRTINCHEPYRTLPLLLEAISDPFIPWIHDYFVVDNMVRFVAQNKRRCHTGRNKKRDMEFWEPQISLFQPIGVVASHRGTDEKNVDNGTSTYHLTDPEHADFPETRFRCHFRNYNDGSDAMSFSIYPFNYEYINWRKRADNPMFVKDGPDVKIVDYSTLLFACPIPESFQQETRLYLDIIPIRTRARYDEGYLLTAKQIGETEFAKLKRFDTVHRYGNQTELPPIQQVGRIENLPICIPKNDDGTNSQNSIHSKPMHRLVACAWVAASYERRGGKSSVSDTPQRLKEWLAFHQLAGFDQIYVYDNTQMDDNDKTRNNAKMPLKQIVDQFPGFVTWIRWPVKVCNNNFIGGRWPGERSSQYAAESSCRERFGRHTEWMSFMDIDEYLIPIRNDTWGPLLDEKGARSPVLGIRESRARPRFDMMEETNDPRACGRDSTDENIDNKSNASCLVPRSNETFLSIFNCDTVKPPRPKGYFTNMKQIYRPDFVLSHFVHYSLITRGIAEYYKDKEDPTKFRRKPSEEEKGLSFLDELHEGTMLHSRSVLPNETREWSTSCVKESKHECKVGLVCSNSTHYDDRLVSKNMLVDENGEFCNCWHNHLIDEWVPKLEAAMHKLETTRNQ